MRRWEHNQWRLIQNHVSRSATNKYKPILSRILQKDSIQILLMKIIFLIEYPNLLKKDLIFVNNDETMLYNHTKRNYSWVNRSNDNTIKIIFVSGSLSFIAVITS